VLGLHDAEIGPPAFDTVIKFDFTIVSLVPQAELPIVINETL